MSIDEKAVFNAARQIRDAQAREAYLQGAYREDAGALARVRELLRAHEEQGSFLESPAVAFAAPEPPLESIGTAVGPYKLLEQIGEGGFGVVFMAEQTAPVRRKVALKVIKPGMDTKQVIARFEAERQALALMDHPNIARVLDAGTTGAGRPYFVMELVRGIPITEYCDAHRLAPRQRLDLFVTVCHAVQHAHQKGIIHRDLKPSNVLVALHDDRPVPKVIDFGIAKATSGQLTDGTLFTAFAQMIGTPLYMSPEQASMNALDVDTRSDVYSLGVLLYELLTGTTPFDGSRMKAAAFDEIRRIVREEEPATPSMRLSTSDSLPSVAANRGTEPAKLTRLVRGELDWIVMKALEKDRTRRYETANGFAMDVQRYLADEPVSACPPSAARRLRRLVRRHKGALLVAALVSAMLLVVAGSLGWMARDSAARHARTAEAVAVLLDQCERALEADAADRAALALDAAERRAAEGGAGELEGRLARCRADVRLLRELDAAYVLLWTASHTSRPTAARFRAALAEYGVSPEGSRAAEAAARVNGSVVRDRVLTALDLWLAVEGSAGVRDVLRAADPDPYRDAVRDAMAPRDGPVLVALAARPEALAQPPRFSAVLGLLREIPPDRVRAVMESAVRDRPSDLGVLMTLGKSYEPATEYDAPSRKRPRSPAERPPAAREADDSRVRWLQAAVAAHPGSLAARNNLGAALAARGDLDGAIACYEEAIRIDSGAEGAVVRHNLGNAHRDKGDADKAIACYEEAIRIDPTYASAHVNLGNELRAKGDRDRAIACYEAAIRADPGYAVAHSNLGDALRVKGEPDRAIACFEEAIRLEPRYAGAHNNLGNVLRARGQLDRAIACLEEAIRIDPTFAHAHATLGGAFSDKGDPDRAIPCFEQAIRLDPTDARAHAGLGAAFCLKGDRDKAIACLEEAIRIDPSLSEAHSNLGAVFSRNGDRDRALACYEEAVRLDPNNAVSQYNLGAALYAKGDPDRAITCFEAAIRRDPTSARAHCHLGVVLFHGKGESERAITCFEAAIRLDPNDATARFNLGNVLAASGDLEPAIARFEEALRLDPKDADARRNLGRARELLALEARLAPVLAGGAATPAELLELADLCLLTKKRTADAALLYGRAFLAEPILARALDSHRYNAACAAALAAGGRGVGAETLAPPEKARFRGMAFDWLQTELAAYGGLPAGDPAVADQVVKSLRHWLDDSDLSAVRDAPGLAHLPDTERERWTKLWADVRDLMARAARK